MQNLKMLILLKQSLDKWLPVTAEWGMEKVGEREALKSRDSQFYWRSKGKSIALHGDKPTKSEVTIF